MRPITGTRRVPASANAEQRAERLREVEREQPAPARYGPNGIGTSRRCRANTIIAMPTVAPTAEASRMIAGMACQPNHAPERGEQLEVAIAMPSLPVASLNAQNTVQRMP